MFYFNEEGIAMQHNDDQKKLKEIIKKAIDELIGKDYEEVDQNAERFKSSLHINTRDLIEGSEDMCDEDDNAFELTDFQPAKGTFQIKEIRNNNIFNGYYNNGHIQWAGLEPDANEEDIIAELENYLRPVRTEPVEESVYGFIQSMFEEYVEEQYDEEDDPHPYSMSEDDDNEEIEFDVDDDEMNIDEPSWDEEEEDELTWEQRNEIINVLQDHDVFYYESEKIDGQPDSVLMQLLVENMDPDYYKEFIETLKINATDNIEETVTMASVGGGEGNGLQGTSSAIAPQPIGLTKKKIKNSVVEEEPGSFDLREHDVDGELEYEADVELREIDDETVEIVYGVIQSLIDDEGIPLDLVFNTILDMHEQGVLTNDEGEPIPAEYVNQALELAGIKDIIEESVSNNSGRVDQKRADEIFDAIDNLETYDLVKIADFILKTGKPGYEIRMIQTAVDNINEDNIITIDDLKDSLYAFLTFTSDETTARAVENKLGISSAALAE